MNKFYYGFVVALAIMMAAGCSSVFNNQNGIFGGKAQVGINQIKSQINLTDVARAQTNEVRLKHIGAFAKGGVEYSLNQITNPTPQITIAKQMNDRVEALAGKPDFNEVQSIQGIVTDLLSSAEKQQELGAKLLAQKDQQIVQIQQQDAILSKQKDQQVNQALQQATKDAQAADKANQTLSQMDKWFGLGAIWYGIKKFVIDAAWFLGIGGVLFLVLRLASYSNPIAASIFTVFEHIGSWGINTLSVIFPKALSIAGTVSENAYNGVKGTLKTLIDCVETVKLQSSSSNQPASLETLLNTAELSMTPSDKVLIENIKVELGWIKPATVSAVAPLTPITGTLSTTSSMAMTITSSISGSLPVSGSV